MARNHSKGKMNSILAVLLLLGCASAQDFNNVKHMRVVVVPKKDSPFGNQQNNNSSDNSTESDGDPQLDGRIINGAPATLGQFPWQAYILMDDSWICGGSIISSQWILTAGHCADIYDSFLICVGKTDLSKYQIGQQCVYTTTKIVNLDYDRSTNANDIALLKVDTLSFSTTVSAVQLPKKSDASDTFDGQSALVSGFGDTETGSSSDTLQYVQVTVISNSQCQEFYNIFSTMICTYGENYKETCNGDSGGALVYQEGEDYTEIGIVSFGVKVCASAPSVYTRVTSYLDWISENTGIVLRS